MTWDALREFGAPGVTNSFQAVLGASGSIEVVYPGIQTVDSGMTGISNGVGRIIPAETDFVLP